MLSTASTLLCRLGAATLLLCALAPAHAQYSWIDDKGTRVFSDRPPPPGTPAARILKAPRAATVEPYGPTAPAAAAPAAPAPAPARPAPPTLAEREADFSKRAAQREQDERKAAQEAQRLAAQEARCKSLKRQEMALSAGTRLSEFDDKGERHYVTDAERAERLAQARSRQAAECR